MKFRNLLRITLLCTLTALCAHGFLGLGQALALENVVQRLSNPEMHCGQPPPLDLFNGVVNALAEPQITANQLTLQREDWHLELLIHFTPKQTEIPENCLQKLEVLNEATKAGHAGPILIRSTTETGAGAEMDLALASQRLDLIEQYLRGNRLARRAFVLELHPAASSPLFGEAINLPNMIEIYSSPAN